MNFNKLWLCLALAVSFTSCLKDKGYDQGLYGAVRNTEGQEYVSIPMGAKASHVLTLESGAQSLDLFPLSYDNVNPAASDFTTKIKVNNSLVTAFDPTVEILPSSAYTIPSADVKFSAGSRISEKYKMNVNTTTLDPAKVYGIGFSIESVSKPGVKLSTNLNNVLYIFTVKNRFDGVYTMEGTLVDNAVGSLSAKSPAEVHLITEGADKVKLYNSGTAVASFKDLFPIKSGSSESAYGSFQPLFTFDANNNVISVTNTYGQPAGNTRSAELDPSGVNKWDPVTKTLKVKWFMIQPSAISGVRATFDFTFTFKGKRP